MRELTLPSPLRLCGAAAVVWLVGFLTAVLTRQETVLALAFGVALVLWMLGTVSWALSKGRHWGWGLLGLSVIGIVVIAMLQDRTKQPTGQVLDLRTLPPGQAAQQWACPKCGAETPNTSYTCSKCGYSVV